MIAEDETHLRVYERDRLIHAGEHGRKGRFALFDVAQEFAASGNVPSDDGHSNRGTRCVDDGRVHGFEPAVLPVECATPPVDRELFPGECAAHILLESRPLFVGDPGADVVSRPWFSAEERLGVLASLRIREHEAHLGVDHEDGFVRTLENGRHLRLRCKERIVFAAQVCLEPADIGDVAGDTLDADRFAMLEENTGAQLNVTTFAVGADDIDLENA